MTKVWSNRQSDEKSGFRIPRRNLFWAVLKTNRERNLVIDARSTIFTLFFWSVHEDFVCRYCILYSHISQKLYIIFMMQVSNLGDSGKRRSLATKARKMLLLLFNCLKTITENSKWSIDFRKSNLQLCKFDSAIAGMLDIVFGENGTETKLRDTGKLRFLSVIMRHTKNSLSKKMQLSVLKPCCNTILSVLVRLGN